MEFEVFALRSRVSSAVWNAMEEYDMTQKQLSEESGVDVRVINAMLYNRNTIRLESLVSICRVLGISIDSMVGLYDEDERDA